MPDSLLKRFEQADEVREFPLGRFEIVHLAGVTLGRATYQPGWKWSVHNAPSAGTRLCHAPHTGTVLSGHGAVQYEDGRHIDLLPGNGLSYHDDAARQLGRRRRALRIVACLESAWPLISRERSKPHGRDPACR